MKDINNLKNAFGSADEDFCNNVYRNLEKVKASDANLNSGFNIKNERPVPRGFSRRVVVVAVVVILTLAATAFASGYYLGSFGRLREIVGDQLADTLQPVEVSNVVGRQVLNVEGSHVLDEGFRVELVAVGVNANVVDLYLTLEDLTGTRLDGDIQVLSHIRHLGAPDMYSVSLFSDVIDRTADGIVTLHRREAFIDAVTGQELEFVLSEIIYGFRVGELNIDLDLSTVSQQEPAAWLWDTPILPPHLHDIDVALEGFECAGFINISSIGIIGERLHIQEQYDMTALNRWYDNKVSLIDPHGEIVHPLPGTRDDTASISFRIDQQGNFYNDRGYNFVVDFPYRENIFEVDPERLSEYRLIAFFDTSDREALSWTYKFEVDLSEDAETFLVVDGLNIWCEGYSSTIDKVKASPHSLLIFGVQGFHADPPYDALSSMPSLQIRINMSDGTAVGVTHGFVQFSDFETRQIIQVMEIDANSIDLDSVVSIVINGEVIELR